MSWRRSSMFVFVAISVSLGGACGNADDANGTPETTPVDRDWHPEVDTDVRDPDEGVRDPGGDGRQSDTGVDPDGREGDPSGDTGPADENVCPTAIATGSLKGNDRQKERLAALPLEAVQLDGSASSDPDGRIVRYAWSIIDRPEGSKTRLTPSASAEKPQLFLDLAGTYRVELVVYDEDGKASSCHGRAIVEITARTRDDIHVQLVWETPGDPDPTDTDGTDLDLHYLHPNGRWNQSPYDIFWDNETADWGRRGDAIDDPTLDIDDTDGRGPENVNHNDPEDGTAYTVGVYYKDADGFGPSYATVRIFIGGELKREFAHKELNGSDDFWKVALIEWPSKNIYQRDETSEGFPSPGP